MTEHVGVMLAVLDHWRLTTAYLAILAVALILLEALR